MRRIAVAALVVCASAWGLAAQQQQQPQQQPPAPPTFRVEVDAVELDVFVTDAQGSPVTDLTAADFEVLEGGRPQTITSFTQVDIPIEPDTRPLYSGTSLEPDVRSNEGEGRLYVIALDEVRADLALRTRHFLRRFIEERFAANDVAAVVFVGRARASDAQDFTSNRRLLLNAIDKFSGGFTQEGLPAATVTDPAPGPLFGVPAEQEAAARARMRSLRDLLEFMAGVRGRRKTMLYVTEQIGDVQNVLDYNGGTRSIAYDDLHTAITYATRGNVSIYPIDPRGLSPEGALGDAEVAPSLDPTEGLARVQGLRALAEATGGFALVNSNSFDDAFTRIVRENSSYYVVGFTSSNTRRDGRFRRISVRVNRPGVQVRTRAGYLAPRSNRGREPERPNAVAGLSAAVGEALSTPFSGGSLPMRVFAAPYRGEDRSASVALAIEIDGRDLNLTEKGGVFTGRLEVAHLAISADGKSFPGDRHAVNLALKPDTYAQAQRAGIRLVSRQDLPPGRYQVRAAAGFVGGRTGHVTAELEIPDYTRTPFTMSGVSITTSLAARAVSLPMKNPLEGLLPGPVTTRRVFSPDDTITLYTEVYESARNAATHTVDLKAELRSDTGRVVTTTTETRSSSELKGQAGGYGFLAELPLKDAEPGLYVIHVEAVMNMGDRPVVSRDIPIRIAAE